MQIFDFRSDTTTQPTERMRQAMANAVVGDDVYGEDPTVNALEEKAARLLGKESGLFVTSGTMGNLVAVLAHCTRGEEAIMGTQGHTFLHEAGGVSVVGSVVIHTVPNQADGTMALNDLENALRYPNDPHEPISRLVILENTQNACGGIPLTLEYTQKVADFARLNGLKLHLDGARIFNAAVALGIPASQLAAPVDSVTFCLSKGLCAPVGSVLCGSADFISKARRLRKLLGGGMRQAGILAAAALHALEHNVARLADDHANAARLARGLVELGLGVDPLPETNIVLFGAPDRPDFAARLRESGVLVNSVSPGRFRAVTHLDVSSEDVDEALSRIRRSCG